MMKYVPYALFLTLSCVWAQDQPVKHTADLPPIMKIGAAAVDFDLPGVDGNRHSLHEYDKSKVLAIVFTCDHCPVAEMYEQRIERLTKDYKDRGVAVVAINPNKPEAVHLSEMGYTDLGDSLDEMKIRAKYRHFNFPYLSDGATQETALKYGPTATPHVFIFDQERKLRYEGRVDSNAREALATKHEARDAIEAVLAGRPVAVENTPAVGCSTKWAYKAAGTKAEIAQWEKTPVTVQPASMELIQTLRKNQGTGKLLLVNFWATWCAPCVEEFPELQTMLRMYRKRQIDIATVSLNAPDERNFVQKFLEEQHAMTRNYQFDGTDSADAVKAFGNDWAGGVPYTVLIGMDGQILYQEQGSMNVMEVRRAILRALPDDHYLGQQAYWNNKF
jgi:peroxiredoxin